MFGFSEMFRDLRWISKMLDNVSQYRNNPHHGLGGRYRPKIQPQPKLTKNQLYIRRRKQYKVMPYAN